MAEKNKRNFIDYLLIGLRGMAMGAVDVVPGMSGGTIALITGIYHELILSIKSFNINLLHTLRKQGIRAAWDQVNGRFLLALVAGVLISIFSLARLMSWLLEHHAMQVWAFFFGLIVGSAIFVGMRINRWSLRAILFLLAGTALAYWVTIATPASTPDNMWFIFLSGSIALCAMILPGVSGAFILILLGKYEFMLQAAAHLNIPVIAMFGMGGIAGLLAFSHLIGYLFKTHPNATLALLAGFMAGSLNKLWPWKHLLETRLGTDGQEVPLLERSISPWTYAEIYGQDPMLLPVILFALAGLALITVFTILEARKK